MTASVVPESVDEITAVWLSMALGVDVDRVDHERVGSGQSGMCFRLRLTSGDEHRTLLAKLPAQDAGTRALMAGTYGTELRFYDQLAATVAIRTPRAHAAAGVDEEGRFVLLLDDLAPAVQGDQVAGCTPEQAGPAVENLAGLHGPRWCDPTLLDVEGLAPTGDEDAQILQDLYGPTLDTFEAQLGSLLSSEDVATMRACAEVTKAWILGRPERLGLVHGDYRLDNLMFSPDGTTVHAVDWQTLTLGLPARDLAFFLGTGLGVDDRRRHEEELVARYHARLLAHGVGDYDLATCWDDYRYAMPQGPLIAAFGCAYGTRTERGDQMFAAMVSRSCTAIRDLESLALVA